MYTSFENVKQDPKTKYIVFIKEICKTKQLWLKGE